MKTSELEQKRIQLEANPLLALEAFKRGYTNGAEEMLIQVQEHLLQKSRDPSQNLRFQYRDQIHTFRCFPYDRDHKS